MTTASTSKVIDLSPPFTTPLHKNTIKRKRISESPSSSRSASSPFSDDDDDDDDSTSSFSSATTPGRTPKTNKASAEKDPIRAARLEARAARNRVSAQHSRDRKKNHVQSLEAEVAQLRDEKAEMAQRIGALEDLVKTLLSAGAANAKGVVDPTATTSTGFSLLSSPSYSEEACPSPLSLDPQTLIQASDSLLAAPTSTPLPAVSASLSCTKALSLINTNDLTVNNARLPAAEAIESTLCAPRTQQRALLRSSLSVKESNLWQEQVRSRFSSEWMSQSTAAAVKQTSCLGMERDGTRSRLAGQAQRRQQQKSDWTMKPVVGWHNMSKESSNRQTNSNQTIRIRIRVRRVKKTNSRFSVQAKKMKLAEIR